MAVREVVTWGDPRLKKDSEDVGAWTPELDQLVADMFETALAEEGVGLAAPQIGINLNLAVIDCLAARIHPRRSSSSILRSFGRRACRWGRKDASPSPASARCWNGP